jgi:hypothetical protein
MNVGLLVLGNHSGSSLVEDVEDAHPQHEHYHPQHEDGTVEVSISRMPGLCPKTTVIHSNQPQLLNIVRY